MDLSNRIAIVGLGGNFPGAPTLERFWTQVRNGVDAAREAPAGRWLLPADEAYDPGVGNPDHVYSKRGCFLDPLRLDTDGLQLDPALVAALDPLYHLALHAGRQAFLDGLTRGLDLGRVGVILGNLALPTDSSSALAREVLLRTFEERVTGQSAPSARPTHPLNRYVTGLPAELVGQALGLGGTCHTLDAACASSLYAVKLAVDELLAGRADAMLAGGVSRPDCLYTQMGFSQLHALSPSGRCAPFDAAADGLVVGEGCGVLLLKRLADAVRAGDRIHAVIAGIGVSNDVQGKLLAPSSEGQLRAMRAAYQQAGWAPQDVALIECHATGTPVGDATEFASLRTLWGAAGWRPGQCVIGSVKSNIGHTLTAAGSAALLKALLAMRAQTLPPTANFVRPAAPPDYEASPFRVLSEAKPWADAGRPRRAAVSAFGFGGINAHVLLEEWRPTSAPISLPAVRPQPAVAIVGMEARFGPRQSLRAFQERMLGGRPDDQPTAPTRWWGVNESAWGRAELAGIAERRGWFIDELALPADRFRIPPRELEELLPQQLLMLQAAAGAIADAKWNANQLLRTGVFLGVELDLNTTNYQLRWALPERARQWAQQLGLELTPAEFGGWLAALREATGPALNANRTMGGLASVAASRIAREFHIGGPSFTLSSEETSGLHALHVAVHMLQNGELDQALVGAVDFAGEVRSVLAGNDGTPADGATALVLKRHDDALRDGDRIYAVIRDVSATRQAGGVSPPRVSEHSDASTPLGGLTPPAGLAAGAATGLAAVVAHALSLHQEMLPGRYWLRDRASGLRRTTVSTSSVGGQQVQVTLEEHATTAPRPQPFGPRTEALFAVEADDVAGLLDGLCALRQEAVTATGAIEALARHWWHHQGSQPRRQRCVVLLARDARELERLADTASQALRDQPQRALTGGDRIVYAPEPLGPTGQTAFVFPGSGNHFPGMGRDLAAQWAELLRRQDAENTHLRSQYLPELFWDAATIPATASHRDFIFGQVTLGILVAELLQHLGVRPDSVIGYSLGETVSLFATRAWTQRDEMLRRMTASPLFTHDLGGECRAARAAWKLPAHEAVDWTAGVLACPAANVRQALAGRERVYLLIVNTPRECVIGGQRSAVEALVRDLRCGFLPLTGVSTVHCEVARPVEAAYRELHTFPTTPTPRVRYYSGALAKVHELTSASAAESITAQAVAGSDFCALIEQAYADGVRLFVEAGPGASCSRMIAAILEGRPHLARSACVAGQDAVGGVLRVLAHLLAERVPVNLGALYGQDLPFADPVRTGRELVVPVGGAPFRAPPRPGRSPMLEPEPAEPLAAPEYFVPEVVVFEASVSAPDGLVSQLVETQEAIAESHGAYLSFAERLNDVFVQQLSLQMALLSEAPDERPGLSRPGSTAGINPAARPQEVARASVEKPWLDRAQCLEFARGSVGAVLGPEFAGADAFPTRVRLPDEPLMLCDRIMAVEGTPRSLTHGRLITEHDVLHDGWYLDAGRIPTCIAVEAGQADLFLSGWLGIDFQTRGLAVYRLLDAVVTFHQGLPEPGDVIRYDIRIERFFRQGETYLFRFSFEGTVDGQPLLSMAEGCAGFFSAGELAAGKGVVQTELDKRPRPGVRPTDWQDLVPQAVESYDAAQVEALRRGDLAGCFGSLFAHLPLTQPLPLPGGRMRLVDRVVRLDPTAGKYGLGMIRAEADIHPDDWFITCHFVDDQVMPGTLMYECCLHTLRILLMRMGWVGEAGEVVPEPVPGVASRLKCRGQVVASTQVVTYEVVLKEIGYRPEPFVIADALMYADGKAIVEITDMSLRLTGLTRARVEEIWRATRPALFTRDHILAFAVGKPSEAFGARYTPFDQDRIIARLPGPPYMFIDRVPALVGEPWVMKAGTEVVCDYDVPADAWYFAANRSATMPFAVLLEVALQPCGFLAAYMGSALTSDVDMSFRNLGGTARQFRQVTPQTGTLTTTVKTTRVSTSGGMIIQNYTFRVTAGDEVVYEGDTYFGFFTRQALAQQVGVREATPYIPTEQERASARSCVYPDVAPFPDRLMRMMDRVDVFAPAGGPHGLGFIQGSKVIDPEEWFFKAHFYQDPVWPGSLGLEAFVQLLKAVAADRWGSDAATDFSTMALGKPQRWLYRGQVVPRNKQVTVQAVIKTIDDERRALEADGFLIVDGLPIYQMIDFGLRLETDIR